MRLLRQPGTTGRLGDELIQQLSDERWQSFRCAVAFVKSSGVRHLRDALIAFSRRAEIRMTMGVDLCGTSYEGLRDLLEALGSTATLTIFHNENPATFHTKMWVFRNETEAVVIVGSGNLTEGGLFTNYEVAVAVDLNLDRESDSAFLKNVEESLQAWESDDGTKLTLTETTLTQLRDHGYVLSEAAAEVVTAKHDSVAHGDQQDATTTKLFTRKAVPKAPYQAPALPAQTKATAVGTPKPVAASKVAPAATNVAAPSRGDIFLMVLQTTDVGVGQVRPGAARRSPEVFIPLAARDYNPDFWGWPTKFIESPTKYDRSNVSMRVNGAAVEVNIFGWKLKRDLRLRSESLRSAGSVGDILMIEAADPTSGFEYIASVISSHSADYPKYLQLCNHPVPNSKKRWGYA